MSPRTPRPLLAGVVALCIAATLGIVSCTRGERDLGDSLSGDGGSGGPLSSADGGSIGPDANDFLSLCKSSTCPLPYATCPNDTFECETNFDRDNTNCGACGIKCPQGQDILTTFNAEWFCQSGKCQMQCNPLLTSADCNHDVADGCESDLCDNTNCGACGNKCPAGLDCVQGNCGCPPGFTGCGGCHGACVNLENNDQHCGACGRECPTDPPPSFPHTIFGCLDSECGKVKCDWGWKDCNSDLPKDGCEIDTASDPLNCGGCGKQCAPGQTCFNGKCECKPSETLCQIPEYEQVYCANLATDIFNCGACRHECPYLEGIVSVCNRGRCELQCPNGYADCDGRPENGCETFIAADPRNCGSCGTQCDLAYGQPCVGGVCLMAPCSSGGTQ